MIILFFFISLWLGISFKSCWYIISWLFISILFISFRKFGKKICFALTFVFACGIGISFIKFSYNTNTFPGIVYQAEDNYYLFNSRGEKFYVYEKNNQREVGDILEIQGNKKEIDFVTYESSFDFASYLRRKGIYSELETLKVKNKFSAPIKIHKAKKIFLSHFNDANTSIISSILFSTFDNSIVHENSKSLHLGKFLSANGTYVYVFVNIMEILLSLLIPKKWAEIGSVGILSIYFIFTFPRFSIIRITLLFIFRWINKYLLKNKFNYLEVIGISGIFFLLINHHLAGQDSFILGYLVPIVLFFIREAVKQHKKISKKVLPIVLLYIFLIPFEIKFYNGISPLSFVYQIILSPIYLLIGIIGLLCFFRLPLYLPLRWVCDLLANITGGLTKISFELHAPTLNPICLVVYYFLFLALLYFIKIKFKPINKLIIGTQLAFLAIYIFPIKNAITNEVTFINVGQGDSCLIRNKNKTILIDTGGLTNYDLATNSLIPFFEKKRLYKIDLVITTHDDYDHYGALDSLRSHFKVKNYIKESNKFPINIGDITLTNYNNHVGEFKDNNPNSLVIGFKFLNKYFLVTGDATKETEKLIMEDYSYIPCDILKVGHHGSKTSSSHKFLKFLNPKEAVISVGKNNKYHLPDEEVILELKRLNIPIKRTDYLGSVTYKNYIFNA